MMSGNKTDGTKAPKKRAKKAAPPPVVRREATAREQAQIDAQRARNRERFERPESQSRMNGAVRVVTGADDQPGDLYNVALLEAFGTRSEAFINDTLENISFAMTKDGNLSDRASNAAVAIMAAIEPENELEATLAAQMVVANDAAMQCVRQMRVAQFVDQQRIYGDLANKYMRTFTAQVEALAKLRRKGEQVVRHVHVHEGGKAVVADTINQQVNHSQGGGVSGRNVEQCYGTEVLEGCAALSGPDAPADLVPVASDAERPMQAARREESGRSEGQP